MKLGVIGGAGRLGATAAFCVGLRGCVEEIKLLDVRENMAQANAIDMTQALLPVSHTKVSCAKSYADFSDCGIILNAAARPYSKEITDRAQELRINVGLVEPICRELRAHSAPDAVMIVSANPVDVFVYMYRELLGWDGRRVLGLSANDSIRLKWAVEQVTGRRYANLGGMCVGEHGGGTVRLYDQMSYGGAPLTLDDGEIARIEDACSGWFGNWVALQTGTTTGYTSGVTLAMMVEAIAADSDRILPCSTALCGALGYAGCAMGLPVRLGAGGVKEVIDPHLTARQRRQMDAAAEKIRGMLRELDF